MSSQREHCRFDHCCCLHGFFWTRQQVWETERGDNNSLFLTRWTNFERKSPAYRASVKVKSRQLRNSAFTYVLFSLVFSDLEKEKGLVAIATHSLTTVENSKNRTDCQYRDGNSCEIFSLFIFVCKHTTTRREVFSVIDPFSALHKVQKLFVTWFQNGHHSK